MSHVWIRKNIPKAIESKAIVREILAAGKKKYSRHLFYSPLYHPSGSPAEHAEAITKKLPPHEHTNHAALHYDEDDVKRAVNKRKAALRKKFGGAPGLGKES